MSGVFIIMRREIRKEVRLENINTDSIDEVLDGLKKRDETDRGYQPGLILGCFRSLNISDNSKCMECPFYTFLCEKYLKDYFKK